MTSLSSDKNTEDKALPQEKAADPIKQEETKPSTSAGDGESKEDPNWRAFREARKQDRAAKEAAERRAEEKEKEATALKAAMEVALSMRGNQTQAPSQANYGTYYGENQGEESEDDRINKKVQAAISAKEQEFERLRVEKEHKEYPQKLLQAYSDFNTVVSEENLDYLEFHHPELARPLKRLRDDFDKWSDIYQMVKKYVPNSTTSKREAAKAENNMHKPKSLSSASVIQPGETRGSSILTEEKRAANWERMQKQLRSVG